MGEFEPALETGTGADMIARVHLDNGDIGQKANSPALIRYPACRQKRLFQGRPAGRQLARGNFGFRKFEQRLGLQTCIG